MRKSDKPEMKQSWAVMYRAASGRLMVLECKTEREARRQAGELKGTYQMIEEPK